MATHLYKDYSKERPDSPHVISASQEMSTTLCGSIINVKGFNNTKVTQDVTEVDCIQCAGIYFLTFMGRR